MSTSQYYCNKDKMSKCQSFSSNHRCCSQSRKISIGVMVDSISKEGTKDIKDRVMLIAENRSPNQGNCVKDHGGHTSLLETNVAAAQKDAPPWFSTKCFNPKASSSVAVHVTEQSPSSLATSRMQSRLKLLEKACAANSAKFSVGKTGLASDERGQKTLGKITHFMDAGEHNNVDHSKNIVFSNKSGIVLENEQVQDKDRKIETAGNETLRMKLWKVLGNISPNQHCTNPQSVKLLPNEDGCRKQSPIEERNPNSEKIESDSEKHTLRRPMIHSLNRKKPSTKSQRNKIESKKPTCHSKVFPQKRILSFKEDWSGRLYDNSNGGSLTSKRNKIEKQSSVLEMHHCDKNEIAEKKQQSESKSRSIPIVEKSMVQRSELVNPNRVYDQKYDVFEEPNQGTERDYSIESSHAVMNEQQKDVEQLMDVEIPNLKDQVANSFLKNRGTCVQDPLIPSSETKSPDSSPKSKQGKLDHGNSPAKKIIFTQSIRSFKSLSGSKAAAGKSNVQLELSDGRCELNESLHIKPSCFMEDDREHQMSSSSTKLMDAENLEDDSDMKDGTESEQLSPEVCVGQKFPHGTDTSPGKENDVEMTECIQESKSSKGTQDGSELQIYLEQNHEGGLAGAVALFNAALRHVKMKLKSISTKKSAEILWAAGEEIFLLVKNAESQIKSDVGKLTNFNQSKRKQLENRFKEKQEQLLGIYKRFKDEVDWHLKDYNDIIEDAEETVIELKRTVGKQRAAHKMLISQVEQEIKVQLEDAESRIMAVQKLAKEKMLQLRLVVAESVKHDAFG